MSGISLEYGSETRYGGEKFGRGRYNINSLTAVAEETPREIAMRLAWSNGCPIAQELTGPDSPYSLEWMINRYGETNSWYKFVVI